MDAGVRPHVKNPVARTPLKCRAEQDGVALRVFVTGWLLWLARPSMALWCMTSHFEGVLAHFGVLHAQPRESSEVTCVVARRRLRISRVEEQIELDARAWWRLVERHGSSPLERKTRICLVCGGRTCISITAHQHNQQPTPGNGTTNLSRFLRFCLHTQNPRRFPGFVVIVTFFDDIFADFHVFLWNVFSEKIKNSFWGLTVFPGKIYIRNQRFF